MSETLANDTFLLQAVACVKDAGTGAGVPGMQLPEEDAPVVRDFVGDLCVVYLVDEGDQLAYVQNHHLRQSNWTADGLHECALSNLARSSEGKARVATHGPIQAIRTDGMTEASLVLLDHVWDENLARMAPNGFVVALPERGVLVFCDAASQDGVAELRKVVEHVFAAGGRHLLTRSLYRRREKQWQPMP